MAKLNKKRVEKQKRFGLAVILCFEASLRI